MFIYLFCTLMVSHHKFRDGNCAAYVCSLTLFFWTGRFRKMSWRISLREFAWGVSKWFLSSEHILVWLTEFIFSKRWYFSFFIYVARLSLSRIMYTPHACPYWVCSSKKNLIFMFVGSSVTSWSVAAQKVSLAAGSSSFGWSAAMQKLGWKEARLAALKWVVGRAS